MANEIRDLFNGIPQLKNDFKMDWKEDVRKDWKVDFGTDLSTVPTNSVAPSLSGNVDVGSTLTAANGTWANSPTFTYSWLRGTTVIPGATASTYVLVGADVGSTIKVVVNGENTSGGLNVTSAATATVVATRNTAVPTISGTTTNGQTLTATTGTWTNTPTYTYQWIRGASTVIAGATASTYVLVGADVGTTVKVTVTATTANGFNTATSAATATIA